MSTRGDYTVIKDGAYYSCWHGANMFPAGVPVHLFGEAADIARNGDWDEVIDGWVTKAWVDPARDDALPPTAATMGVASSHPDGEASDSAGVAMLRPRLSSSEVIRYYADGQRLVDDGEWEYLAPHPSWRDGAALPAMCKHKVDLNSVWPEWGVFVDADNREVVLVDYSKRVPVAVASMDDPEALMETARWLVVMSPGYHELPRVNTARGEWFDSDGRLDGVSDGQWRRPAGFLPLPGAPGHYPAKGYGSFTPKALPPRKVVSRGVIYHRPPLLPVQEDSPQMIAAEGIGPIAPAAAPAPQARATLGGPRCNHVGMRSGRRCTRPPHKDRRHRYD